MLFRQTHSEHEGTKCPNRLVFFVCVVLGEAGRFTAGRSTCRGFLMTRSSLRRCVLALR